MRVTVTGATGLVGPAVVAHLRARDAQVTVLSRDPERAKAKLSNTAPPPRAGRPDPPPLEAIAWDPMTEPAPTEALSGREGVVHLAGEPIARRWSARAKRAIRESRITGTRNLIEGLRALEGAAEGAPAPEGTPAPLGAPAPPGLGPRPRVLVSGSAIGYYGHHGEEPLDEEAPAGSDFLARVCVEWETEARRAGELGMRVVQIRTGVVLDPRGGALAKMLPPFRLGIGGPVAGGKQFISWIHRDDLVGVVGAALGSDRWRGPVNATAPTPVSNGEFAKTLGRALHRPALLPVPAVALRALYGEMAEIVTSGARVLPAKPLMLGYRFGYPDLEEALRAALG